MGNIITAEAARLGRMLKDLACAGRAGVVTLASRGATFSEDWLLGKKRALYGLAVFRILIGVMGMGILAANWSTRLYAYGAGSAWTGQHLYPGSDFEKIWLFKWFNFVGPDNVGFTLSYIGLFVIAFLVAIGWRTKFVLPVYLVFYVSFIEMNDLLSDQSDNLLRMVMIYMLFADTSARLSLDARRHAKSHDALRRFDRRSRMVRPYTAMFHNLAIVVTTMHVGFVYMSGALYKAQGGTWGAGTAVYGPLMVDRFSTWPEIAKIITTWGPMVAAFSWGTIILQMMFLPMLLNRITRIIVLIGIMSFHVGIGVLMGLPFFSMAMIAVDAIFVRDHTWRAMGRGLKRAWGNAARRSPGVTLAERRTTADAVAATPVDDAWSGAAPVSPVVATDDLEAGVAPVATATDVDVVTTTPEPATLWTRRPAESASRASSPDDADADATDRRDDSVVV
ncbi:Vitamin K-dependent gamma-carboxylase [Curtobacterium sp. 9128]|uniref:HTTM domain-containing protein n=1 Tax=Curtobacterium sp. 9128 TaxID=1793722 RepID=UPI0007D71FC7|nr:HTTM domain-containing protein [Curtobacterium sp. 9128]SBN64515.1 Vitamin K-dependent gamma-carboxylase [Curtobacterium sp. 9128]